MLAAARVQPRELGLAALATGLLVAPGPRALAVGLAGAGGLAAAAVLRRPLLGALVAGAALAGALAGQARLVALDRTELTPLLGRPIAVRATLLEAPRELSFGGWTAPLRVVAGPGAGERIVVRGRGGAGGARSGPPRWDVGAELAVRGRLEPLAPWESFAARRGAHAAIAAEAVGPTGQRRGGIAGFVDRVRRTAEHGLASGLAPPQAALARGMVLGQDDALDAPTRDAFRASGLSHLLAASGQNVALLALLATGVVAALGGGLRPRLAAALALVALYVPLAGAGPSIQRAGVMGGAALVAGLAGRPATRRHAVLLAVAVTLALNPRTSGDPGWQLSFAAVVALALLAPRIRRSAPLRALPAALADAVAVTVAATLGTAPLLALHFERLSLASLPANVIAVPAVAPVVWLGTLAGALAQLGPMADPLVRGVDAVLALPLGFVALVAATTARAPHATVGLTLGVPAAVGAYAALALAARSRRARALLGGALATLAAGALVAGQRTVSPPRGPTVSFLDVGQGDATLLQDRGVAVLVDTGPPDGPILDRLRAAGVRRLDLLVLTHGQSDHEGAAPRVLDRLPVDAVLDGGATAPAPGGASRAVAAAVAASAARRLLPAAGQVLRAGRLELRVLWPPAAAGADPATAADPNARAVVLHVRDGPLDVLLTADAESPVTAGLELPAVELLKVAHHGSADPGLPALLARLRPRLAAIEVGAGNAYGHPDPGTLAALAAAGVPVLRTDRDGTVRVTLAGDRLEVAAHR